ncbi:hypothetical protein GOBAR_AA08476 [Gossypium barbadense]|uniref:Uncharacterized protein n=1 Tax=Gossypium barbadense TaxID=3634 RepID=A0A2P5Y980_GOSBA|nr:hypothetical protein GOBAR_AA08476 [Gossypium barbadense]
MGTNEGTSNPLLEGENEGAYEEEDAAPSSLVVSMKFVVDIGTVASPGLIHAFPSSPTLSTTPSHPISPDFLTLSTGCKI